MLILLHYRNTLAIPIIIAVGGSTARNRLFNAFDHLMALLSCKTQYRFIPVGLSRFVGRSKNDGLISRDDRIVNAGNQQPVGKESARPLSLSSPIRVTRRARPAFYTPSTSAAVRGL